MAEGNSFVRQRGNVFCSLLFFDDAPLPVAPQGFLLLPPAVSPGSGDGRTPVPQPAHALLPLHVPLQVVPLWLRHSLGEQLGLEQLDVVSHVGHHQHQEVERARLASLAPPARRARRAAEPGLTGRTRRADGAALAPTKVFLPPSSHLPRSRQEVPA